MPVSCHFGEILAALFFDFDVSSVSAGGSEGEVAFDETKEAPVRASARNLAPAENAALARAKSAKSVKATSVRLGIGGDAKHEVEGVRSLRL